MLQFGPDTEGLVSRTVRASIAPGPIDGSWTITFHSEAIRGTLAVFAGTLSAAGLDIFSALVKLNSDHTVTDSFDISPLPGVEFRPEDVGTLAIHAEEALNGRRDLVGELRRARQAAGPASHGEPRITTDTDSSLTTGVSVVCADRPGLLYDMATVLSRHDLRTRALSVLTFNGRAYDTFRVVNGSGEPPSDPAALARLREELRAVCSA